MVTYAVACSVAGRDGGTCSLYCAAALGAGNGALFLAGAAALACDGLHQRASMIGEIAGYTGWRLFPA
jgi:hypothetical protein